MDEKEKINTLPGNAAEYSFDKIELLKDNPLKDSRICILGSSVVKGAIEYIINYVRDSWNCPAVFFTGSRYDSERYDAMVTRLRELQKIYGIGVIDLWAGEEFNSISDEDRAVYMHDGIHPTRAGYRDWWGPEIEKQLLDKAPEWHFWVKPEDRR